MAPILRSYQGSSVSLSYECSTTNARWVVIRDKIEFVTIAIVPGTILNALNTQIPPGNPVFLYTLESVE